METSRYRAMIHAVDEGSLSKAAQVMAYTPSGVSQLVAALERDLGFPLLERTKRGVYPTSAGEELMGALRSIIAEEDRLLQLAAEVKGLSTGSVTIGSYPSVATHWLPCVVKEFHKDFPNIRIQMNEGIHQEIDEWLANKEVDLGFISYEESMAWDWIPLAEDPMVAVLPCDHPLAKSESFPIEACKDEAFIMPGRGQDIDTLKLLNDHNIHPNVVFDTIENSSTMAMVEQGLGISIMNKLVTQRTNFNVACIPVEPSSSITLGIACPSLASASPAARHFVEFTKPYLTKTQDFDA